MDDYGMTEIANVNSTHLTNAYNIACIINRYVDEQLMYSRFLG